MLRTDPAPVTRPHAPVVGVQTATDRHRDPLARFLLGLSTETAYRRFLGADPRPSRQLLDLLLCLGAGRSAAVAIAGPDLVGHAMLVRGPQSAASPRAELAVVVADAWQRRGIGPRLVGHLLTHAAGLTDGGLQFTILAANRYANQLAHQAWPQARTSFDHGVLTYEVPASP